MEEKEKKKDENKLAVKRFRYQRMNGGDRNGAVRES